MSVGFHYSLNNLDDINEDVVQIFNKTPAKYNAPNTKKDISVLKNRNIKIFTHAQYIINIVSMNKNGKLNGLFIRSLKDEIKFLKQFGKNGIGTVIHLGSSSEPFKDVMRYMILYLKAITNSCKDGDPKLILENRAKAGNLILESVDEMIEVNKQLIKYNLDKYVTFCFDTCHDFVTINKTESKETIASNLKKLIDTIGSDRISCIHLNDSKSKTADRHEDIFSGIIPKKDIANVIRICKKYKIPMIIERINSTEEDKKKMIKLVSLF